MFEKEAKERARKLEENQTLGVYENYEDYARDIGWNDGEIAGYEEGFKDGAEFGYNKANKWHDLRKDHNDLPKSSIFHEVLNQNGIKIYYDDVLKKWNMYFNGEIIQAQTPIAWCEIPKFEE